MRWLNAYDSIKTDFTRFGAPEELAKFPTVASWPPCTKDMSLSALKKPSLSK